MQQALGELACSRPTLLYMQQSASRHHDLHLKPYSMASSYQNPTPLHTSMSIYLKNNPGKFHHNYIWNDGALGFFWKRVAPRRSRTREHGDTGSLPVSKGIGREHVNDAIRQSALSKTRKLDSRRPTSQTVMMSSAATSMSWILSPNLCACKHQCSPINFYSASA